MPFLAPVEMDPLTKGGYCLTGGGLGMQAGAPTEWAGALWQILAPAAAFGSLHAFKSVDGGLTWVEKDAANAPAYVEFQSFPHGNAWIIVGTVFNPSNPAINFLSAIIFDMITETWGVPYVSTIPTSFLGPTFFRASTGDILSCVCQTQIPNIPRYRMARFDGGAWHVPFDIDLNSPGPHDSAGGQFSIQGTIDANDTIHLIFSSVVIGPIRTLTYQQVLSTDALGASQNWSDTNQLIDKILDYIIVGCPAVHLVNDYVVIPFLRDSGNAPFGSPSLLIGNGVAAPVWTIWQDPSGYDPDGAFNAFDTIAGDAQILNGELVITRAANAANDLRLSRTTNANPTLAWTAETVWSDPNFQSIVNNPLAMLFGGFLQVSYNDDPVYTGRDQFFARWSGPPPFIPPIFMYLNSGGGGINNPLGIGAGGSVGLPTTLPNPSIFCNKTGKWKPRCR